MGKGPEFISDWFVEHADTEQPSTTQQTSSEESESLPRLAWQTAEVARSLGMRPAALRRLCERRAVRRAAGTLVVRLEHGIIAEKRGGRARWRFVVPKSLLRDATSAASPDRDGILSTEGA